MADRIDKLENAVKKLAVDMAELRKKFGDFKEEMSDFKSEMSEFKSEAGAALANIQRTQTALTHAVTQAVKELGISRTVEARLTRLEAEVFGSKH